jgi:hypothetical protein
MSIIKTINTSEALVALNILRKTGFAKAPALQRQMSAEIGRQVSDDQFEAALAALGHRIIRVRGAGGGIRLF